MKRKFEIIKEIKQLVKKYKSLNEAKSTKKGDTYYVDSDFVNLSKKGGNLKHLGTISFHRVSEKIPGFSGRTHRVSGNDDDFKKLSKLMGIKSESVTEGKLPIDYSKDEEKNWSKIYSLLMKIDTKKKAMDFIEEFANYVEKLNRGERNYENLVPNTLRWLGANIEEDSEEDFPLSSDIWWGVIRSKLKVMGKNYLSKGKYLESVNADFDLDQAFNDAETVEEAKRGEIEVGDFVHFKSANKAGLVRGIKGDKVTILTMKGNYTGDIKDIKVLHQEAAKKIDTEEQLDEKLITFSNRAPYGQVVFMAGGAGSGKGFAISNFIDSASFKTRDVDEMKSQVGKLEKLGKISIDSWYKKFSGNLAPNEREHVEKWVLDKGLTISDIADDLKNPNNVASLHYIVDAMGVKDKWLINMLAGKSNPETLPNLIFDITAKNIKSIVKVITPLLAQGYKSKNIHLVWVLTNYHIAVEQNRTRARVVPDDILLLTHEGAAKTIWSIVTGALPSGLNGRIDVILGGAKNTIMYKDSKGKTIKGAVKGFTTLPVKKAGGGTLPKKVWLSKLYKWVIDNTPKTISLQKPLDTQMEALKEARQKMKNYYKRGY
mgnify:FL=1